MLVKLISFLLFETHFIFMLFETNFVFMLFALMLFGNSPTKITETLFYTCALMPFVPA